MARTVHYRDMAGTIGREHLVVVGNGMVGLEFLVQAVRRGLHIRYRISVFGAEPRPAYDRIRLTETMQGTEPDALTMRPREWYQANGIALHTDTSVAALEPTQHSLTLADGRTVSWDRLVLATGSRPFVPPIPGADQDGIFTYRTLEDISSIQAACQRNPGQSAVIIGGGLLGLELAKSIQEHGLSTTIVEFAPGLMVKQLNPVASTILQSQIEALGMTTRVATETTSITFEPAVVATLDDNSLQAESPEPTESSPTGNYHITYANGESDQAAVVVIAAGIRPRDELAEQAGLRCSPRAGVMIDDYLTTSHPDIFAIGECAVHDGRVYGLAAPGYHMAEVLCKRLNGARLTSFTGFDLSTKLKLAGLDVWTVGDYQGDGRTVSWRRGFDYRQLVVRDGQIVGATIIGSWDELALAQDAVARRVDASERQLKRFEKGESLFGDDVDSPINWPEQALVCTCMQVTRGTLTTAINNGCATVEELSTQTGAGSVCGSCRPTLGELVGSTIPPETLIQSGNKTLLRSSLTAAVLVLPFLLFDIPFDTSIVHGAGWDVLWRDSTIKQITGFTTLGISVIALALSLRKRVFQWGSYGWWRAIHAVLGILALVALVVHTGLRLGANLNLALGISFLALALVGSAAGAISALENRIGGRRIKTIRLWWTRIHIALVWTFVPLVTFHVIKAYSY